MIIIQRFNPPSTNPSTLGVHQHHWPRLHCLNKNVQYLISQNILHLSGQNISYLVDQNVQYLISVNFIRNMLVQDIHHPRRQPDHGQKLQNLVQAVRRHQCGSQVGPGAEGRSPWTARIFNISNKYLINQSI